MTCAICRHGQTRPGCATVTLQRDDAIVVLKCVPADVCENCGEYYLSDETASLVMQRAEAAVLSGVEVTVQRFAA